MQYITILKKINVDEKKSPLPIILSETNRKQRYYFLGLSNRYDHAPASEDVINLQSRSTKTLVRLRFSSGGVVQIRRIMF